VADPICRDCRVWYAEEINDPAPGLCVQCYERRLINITPDYIRLLNAGATPIQVTLWMADALEHRVGERPEYARQHAYTLLEALLSQ
jgi:hypothetical protein